MPPLSPEQEGRLVDALVSLDWMKTHDRKSCELICEQLACSWGDAVEVLEYIYLRRNLIRAIHRGDEQEHPGVLIPRHGWKWERGSE